jgi:hypothetical protein
MCGPRWDRTSAAETSPDYPESPEYLSETAGLLVYLTEILKNKY